MPDAPAAVLRRAAARVRESGAACESSVISLRGVPWHMEECAVDLSPRAVAQSAPSMDERARFGRYIAEAESPELAAWIALMHSGLAEPLAMWLETEARSNAGDEDHRQCAPDKCTAIAALAVAHIILGTPKEPTS